MGCYCCEKEVLSGEEAYLYSQQDYIKEVARSSGGWRYLLRCEVCGTYWEVTWEGGGGFDYGVMTLHRLSPKELRERWPQVKL